MQELSEAYHYQLEDVSTKIDQYYIRINKLEMIVRQFQSKNPHYQQKEDNREEYHKEKVRHQEIESLMLEKYSKYEAEIGELKKTNDRLIQELIKANKTIQDLNQRILNYSQDLHRSRQKEPDNEIVRLIE